MIAFLLANHMAYEFRMARPKKSESRPPVDLEPLNQWVVDALKASGLTNTSLAKVLGIDQSRVAEMKTGKRSIKATEVPIIARETGVPPPSKFLPDIDARPAMVPVVGYVGAGAEIFCIDDHAKGAGLEEVEIPLPGLSPSTVAVRVRGISMEPAYYDGDLIFYDRTDNGDLMHLIGKECVVSLTDGRKFIKILRRRQNGEWYLFSNNAEPIMDIQIEWAAKVKVIQRA